MPDSLLILAPLLVLAVVLLFGFAGCKFKGRLPQPDPVPPTTLIFRARVPTALTVVDGVKFAWTPPTTPTEETATVTSFTTDGADNVYQHQIPEPEAAMGWLGRCDITVSQDSQSADATSGHHPFDLPPDSQSVVLFQAEGSPLVPPFRVVYKGLFPA